MLYNLKCLVLTFSNFQTFDERFDASRHKLETPKRDDDDFLKWVILSPFSVYVPSFQTNNTHIPANLCEKCPSSWNPVLGYELTTS